MFKEFQPQGYPEDQLDKLVESGYEFDEKTNRYIMKSEVTKKNNKNVTTDVILSFWLLNLRIQILENISTIPVIQI